MNVQKLLPGAVHRLSERKVRLLACACCRRAWQLLPSERSRRAVALAERYADGLVNDNRLYAAYVEARKVVGERQAEAEVTAATVAAMAADPELHRRHRSLALGSVLDELARWESDPGDNWCARFLRDVLPPHAETFSELWRTPDVLALARRAYDDRDTSVLPVLSDALEEAGCTETELMSHCRTDARHARGCWALDFILNRR